MCAKSTLCTGSQLGTARFRLIPVRPVLCAFGSLAQCRRKKCCQVTWALINCGVADICKRPGYQPCLPWLRLNGIIDGNSHSLPEVDTLTSVAQFATSLSSTTNPSVIRPRNLKLVCRMTFSCSTDVCYPLVGQFIHALRTEYDSFSEVLGTIMTP